MKYLKQFKIYEELNTRSLSKDEVINLLKTRCQKFISDGDFFEENLIFRKDEDKGDFLFVDPKSSPEPRVAPNTSNFHNLLISNLDSWRGWPRRNRSLICASSGRALSHGVSWAKGNVTAYVVVPFDTTKIATGDRSDFWECFGKIPKKSRWKQEDSKRPSLPYYISELIRDLGYEATKSEFDPNPYTHTMTGVDSYGKPFSKEVKIPGKWIHTRNPIGMDIHWDKLKTFLEEAEMTDELIDKYFRVRNNLIWDKNKNLLQNLNVILDPIYNKFKLGDVTSTMKLYSELDPDDEDYMSSSLESWLEDECILIKYNSVFDSIINSFLR